MQSSLTTKQLDRRATQLIRSVRAGHVSPDSDALAEFAELTEVLSDQPVAVTVVARLTVTRADGTRTIVEVHSDARFHNFYHFYKQCGARRSTKQLIRSASRNEGLNTVGYWAPGLETIASRLEKYASQTNPVIKKSLRIIQRRAYCKLINASPDQLGLTQTQRLPIYGPISLARTS